MFSASVPNSKLAAANWRPSVCFEFEKGTDKHVSLVWLLDLKSAPEPLAIHLEGLDLPH